VHGELNQLREDKRFLNCEKEVNCQGHNEKGRSENL
jgi:hypothetical protein